MNIRVLIRPSYAYEIISDREAWKLVDKPVRLGTGADAPVIGIVRGTIVSPRGLEAEIEISDEKAIAIIRGTKP